MGRFDYILFDLDGTLTDPGVGITNSVAYALDKYGISIDNKSDLNVFIGPPLAESFEKYYNFTHEKALEAVEFYREYFRDRGIFENLIYAGINELLLHLKNAGKQIILATSKPEIFAAQILKHFDIADYFSFIAGSTLDGSRVKKADVIIHALDSLGMIDRRNAIMVGDREHDIIGAALTGLTSVGVLWGYGSRAELVSAGADYIAENVSELETLLLC